VLRVYVRYDNSAAISLLKARFLTGLTATPRRRDGLQPILEMQVGPVRYAVDPKSQAARRPFDQRLIVRETAFTSSSIDSNLGIQRLYASLARDEQRNRLILEDVVQTLAEGRSPILLTERKDHLEHLASRLRTSVRHLVVLRGGMTASERREATTKLADVLDHEPRLVIATGRYVGEGFDDSRLDTLLLTMPVSWKGTLVQYAGRLHRPHQGKTEVRIYDYVDREVPLLLRMFDKRLRGYRAIGYARDEEPLEQHARSAGESRDLGIIRIRGREQAKRGRARSVGPGRVDDAKRVSRRIARPPTSSGPLG
jgi:superfamily II DNA or RNA helicase